MEPGLTGTYIARWSWGGRAGGHSSPRTLGWERCETQPGAWLVLCIGSWPCALHSPAAVARLGKLCSVRLALLPFGPRS